MSKFKIKVGKGDRFFYDSENGRISNGHWVMVMLYHKYEMADKELSGAMMAGKSFARYFKGIEFDAKLPDLVSVMEGDWAGRKETYEPVYRTGWAKINGDEYIIEYGLLGEKGELPSLEMVLFI
jgi:hypothetical protein